MYGRKKDFSGITKISKLSKGDEFCINILASLLSRKSGQVGL